MGKERIEQVFQQRAAQGEKVFIPYITAGDPDQETSYQLVKALARAGASVIELGVPFSDPVADGPVIQAAAGRALAGGMKVAQVLKLVGRIRQEETVPIVLLTYYNPVLQFGLERFAHAAAGAGVDGIIVADLPMEEAEPLRAALDRQGLALIPLVAPTSSAERIGEIAATARGFIYCVSLMGVTGTRTGLAPETTELLARVRAATTLPVAVGFGISTPAQVATVAPQADGVIVGSAIVKVIEAHLAEPERIVPAVTALAEELMAALPSKQLQEV
ncbi:tryptophan synthase subunit alpha [Heliophilum fasciatum]|uniref:Tryptophan synthase alpha chain n=1 Tax=Heliophilum fasciatum TaxID=35700 RepID=A0A4R2RLP8_9FIRM|nr:tryptophan synthase subunit alpha [Heliophilum fasciatum]MCW2278308.1 tryptophan synthase alpha chain [Heliophilum fasciatum]TCP63818.1 tryptophan synthase alpha chain [Heliophilum fasciatum]